MKNEGNCTRCIFYNHGCFVKKAKKNNKLPCIYSNSALRDVGELFG